MNDLHENYDNVDNLDFYELLLHNSSSMNTNITTIFDNLKMFLQYLYINLVCPCFMNEAQKFDRMTFGIGYVTNKHVFHFLDLLFTKLPPF